MRHIISNKVFIVLALCVVGLAVGILSFRRDIAITFHRDMMLWDWYRTDRVGSGYGEGFEHHLAALASLGYFNRSEFPLHHIALDTPEWKGLMVALHYGATNVADAYVGCTNIADANVGFTNYPDAYIGFTNVAGAYVRIRSEIVIWARPELQARFATIISNLDVATNTQPNTARACVKTSGY
jgi:hypothetical protein